LKVIHFSGVQLGEACTIVLRGATTQMLDEAERSIHDVLCVLSQTVKVHSTNAEFFFLLLKFFKETRTVLGAGCSEMLMSKAVEEAAKKTPGKKALALESFATALQMIPTIIADNAGLDSSELISQLKAEHYKGNKTAGIDINTGLIGDIDKLAVIESFKVKQQILLSASEAAGKRAYTHAREWR
jgi:T-complex protein 1 subunit beta